MDRGNPHAIHRRSDPGNPHSIERRHDPRPSGRYLLPETAPAGTPPIPVLSVNPSDTIIGTYTLPEPTIDKDHVRAQVVMQDGADGLG